MTNRISIRSRLTAIVLAAASVLGASTLAGAAQAEDHRIAVGDLSQAGAAHAFMHRLDATARTMCDFYVNDASRPANVAACKAAVRTEALDQLSLSQRTQLAAYDDHGMRMASADR
jgi:UrcA family protein